MSTLQIAVIGAGHWGPNLIRSFHTHQTSEVAWVIDRDPQRLELTRARYPDVRVSTDPTLAFEDPAVDAAIIATPTVTHYPLALAALRGGASGVDVDEFDVPRAAQDEVHDRGIVDGRIGVGLDHDGGDPTRGRRPAGRLQGFLGFRAGLAGLDADVDEAGDQELAAHIDLLDVRGERTGIAPLHDVSDDALGDDHRAWAIVAGGRVDETGVHEGQRAAHSWSSVTIHFGTTGGV